MGANLRHKPDIQSDPNRYRYANTNRYANGYTALLCRDTSDGHAQLDADGDFDGFSNGDGYAYNDAEFRHAYAYGIAPDSNTANIEHAVRTTNSKPACMSIIKRRNCQLYRFSWHVDGNT